MRILMVAGEASGDMHGAGVIRALRRRVPDADVFGIGGDAMRREGMDLLVHCARLSFMGFVEVVRNLHVVRSAESLLAAAMEARRPEVVVLIDFPGFNFRIARRAKAHGIPVLYYISPQVWAWHKGRVKTMKRLVDRMKVILPFEADLYREAGIDVEFVGHPIVERIGSTVTRENFFRRHGLDPARKLIALFPGSRVQEIDHILPTMLAAAERVRVATGAQVALGVAPNLGIRVLRRHCAAGAAVTVLEHATYDLMCYADAALVTSGTATLETGWFGTPMVVVYKTSPATFFIGRLLVDVPYIGLVNIVAGRKIVPEYVQHDMTLEHLTEALQRLVTDEAYAGGMRRELACIRERLGGPGASARVAEGILSLAGAA
jgi:lipid-A-disaccharide synthase